MPICNTSWLAILVRFALLTLVSLACLSGPALGQNPFSQILQCPDGWKLNEDTTLCVRAGQAIGRFPAKMVADCIANDGGSETCNGAIWQEQLAHDLRGKGLCPAGASFDVGRALCIGDGNAYGPFSRKTVAECVAQDGGAACTKSIRYNLAMTIVKNSTVFCPDGFARDEALNLCSGDEWVVGAFPSAMQQRCDREHKGFCHESLWPRADVLRWRGDGKCPLGSTWNPARQLCQEGDFFYGPFSLSIVKSCLEYQGGMGCLTNRIHKTLLPPEREAVTGFGDWYAKNYERVYGEATQAIGSTSNACAAFASTALKDYGYGVPLITWAPDLRKQLAGLGWERITNPAELQVGDVVFTEDETSISTGETGHVFVVRSIPDPRHVYAMDNQGSNEFRNLYRDEDPNKWWFGDAYRPPPR